MKLKTKQIAVIGLVVVLMGLLLSLNIKGLVKEGGQHEGEAAKKAVAANQANVTIETVSATAKQSLNSNLSSQINDLESKLKTAQATDKAKIRMELVQKWDDVNRPAPAALYQEEVAKSESTLTNWLKAGNLFTSAYQSIQDTLSQPVFVQKAVESYQNALKLDSANLEAKTGLGVAYVSGTPNPMEGIQLLLGVVKEDPENYNANLNLGLFSMRSGQYDKAVNRFKTVLSKKETPEAWFYLASTYENLGKKSDAITAYIKARELAAEPSLTKFVDNKIQELSK